MRIQKIWLPSIVTVTSPDSVTYQSDVTITTIVGIYRRRSSRQRCPSDCLDRLCQRNEARFHASLRLVTVSIVGRKYIPDLFFDQF